MEHERQRHYGDFGHIFIFMKSITYIKRSTASQARPVILTIQILTTLVP